MLENIIKSLQSELGDQVVQKTGISSSNLDSVFSIIGDVTKKEVTGQMMSGNLSTLTNLFSKDKKTSAANSLQNNIIAGVITNLISKLGLSKDVADMIAKLTVPTLVDMITNKSAGSSGGGASVLTDIFGSFMGGSQPAGKKDTGGSVADMAKNILGGFLKKK
ncbi:MAG: hypothetical protein WBJ84_00125 [Bacteroidales bacterium]